MSERTRITAFLISAACVFAFLVWGISSLPDFGHYPGPYGDILNSIAVPERHVLNVVTAIIFDYRGFDTLGEEFILFAAVCGVCLLMREDEKRQKDCCYIPWEPGETIRLFSFGFVGLILVFAIYVVITSHLSLGGGFQGGAAIASAWILILLAYGPTSFFQFSERNWADLLEGLGASAYALIGFAALFAGEPFLSNIVPVGKTGDLFSSGTIWLINFFVGIEVAAGTILLVGGFVLPLVRVAEQDQL